MTLQEMSLLGGIVILLTAVLRKFTLNKLPKRMFCALWAVAVIRLLVPLSVQSPVSVYGLCDMLGARASVGEISSAKATGESELLPLGAKKAADYSENNSFAADETAYALETPAERNVPIADITAGNTERTAMPIVPVQALSEAAPVSAETILMVIWAIGTVLCAAYFTASHLKCRRKYKTAVPVYDENVTEIIKSFGLRRKVRVKRTDLIATPLTYGLFRPIILLPKSLKLSDSEELSSLEYILTHEIIHIKRFDAAAKLVLAVAASVHWFNPLAWLMYVLANRDLELACDETVLIKHKDKGRKIRSEYALTLIGMEEKRNEMMPFFSCFSKNGTEERVKSIMNFKKISVVAVTAAILTVVCTTAVFATSPDEEKKENKVSGTIVTNLDNSAWFTSLNNSIDKVTESIKKAADKIKDAVDENGASAIEISDEAQEKFSESMEKLGDGICKITDAIADNAGNIAKTAVDYAKKELEKFKEYEKYGIKYDTTVNQLTYNGKKIRKFTDKTHYNMGMFTGEVDVTIVRDSDGNITDVKETVLTAEQIKEDKAREDEFVAKMDKFSEEMSKFGDYDWSWDDEDGDEADDSWEDWGEKWSDWGDGWSENRSDWSDNWSDWSDDDSVCSENEGKPSEEEIEESAKTYAKYADYGVTYNKDDGNLYYKGKLIGIFWDVTSYDSNGDRHGTCFMNDEGVISIETVRDANGKLTGVKVVND